MTADPWALLAEARESIEQDFDDGKHLLSSDRDRFLLLLARIDAALAAHRDEVPAQDSATDVVEWRLGDDCDEEFVYYEAYPDSDTGLDVVRFKGGKWRWTMSREQQGYGNTLAEAKSAAIAAARGLK
jgi:hypothetical protein